MVPDLLKYILNFLVIIVGVSALVLLRANPVIFRARSRFQPGTERWDCIFSRADAARLARRDSTRHLRLRQNALVDYPVSRSCSSAMSYSAMALHLAHGHKRSTASSHPAYVSTASAANTSLAPDRTQSSVTLARSVPFFSCSLVSLLQKADVLLCKS
jgi:hypothetical protein